VPFVSDAAGEEVAAETRGWRHPIKASPLGSQGCDVHGRKPPQPLLQIDPGHDRFLVRLPEAFVGLAMR
jgi:hypothetical protein